MAGIGYGLKEAKPDFTEPASRLTVEAVYTEPYRYLLSSIAYACVVPQFDIIVYLLLHMRHHSSLPSA
jgi:hypothetical protein